MRTMRPMRLADLDAVMPIEEASYDFPWTRMLFEDCFKAGFQGYVCSDADALIQGYTCVSTGAEEAHILNLCTHPNYRCQGVAQAILEFLFETLQAFGCSTLLLEVRFSVPQARRLYERLGFEHIGVRKDYYPTFTGREDAYVMKKMLEAARSG